MGGKAFYEITLSRPSVRLSVTKFSQKNFFCVCVPNLGPTGLNQAQNDVFFTIFRSSGHYFSLKLHTMIACDNIYHLV